TLRGEAAVLVHLGENARALGAYIEASRLFLEVGDPVGKANCEVDIATLLYNSGAYQQALALFRGARKSFQSLASPLGEANAWLGEADVDVEVGDIKSGMSAYREARKIYLKIEDNNGMGTSWLGESNAFRTNRDWPEVRKAAENAIAAYTKAVIIPGQESAYLLKAEAEIQLGDTKAAVNSASEAIHLHSQWRKTWITDRHRTAQEAAISKAYDFLVPLRARQETQTAEALRLAEEARARVLLDLLATPPNRGENVSASDLMAERQRLEAKIWQIEDKLRNTAALDQQEDLRSQRRQLDQELAWNSYQRIAGQKESLTEAPTLGADSIKALALETGPLLMYYAAEQEVWGFLILPRKGIVVRSVALSWLGLGREIRELTHDLANPILETDAEAQARKLWDLLIGPFSEEIPEGGPLVLVPHGPLHELPFEALLDPAGKPLFEHWQISVTPSASALDFARRRHASPSPSDSFLGFASGRGLNLPTAEVAEISGFFGTGQAAFHPTAANFKNYLERVAQARHLLIATRGVHVEGSRSETYLEIDPTPEVHDSRLSAAEIATIPLQAELVTLAACDTSYGHALLSDERLDLTRSFLIARAAAVLGTRWKVPEDAVTSRFLADFYRLYRHGGPQGKGLRKDEALTEARRRSRERGDPSQLWAAWVLVGDAR
ncbi:MAG TPA: CHAT domain-containing protein, partial [Thermoanaerobaculia bacterium]|nr:CHAT domain-containing protein [Thermoanaerobaculia bacterium]